MHILLGKFIIIFLNIISNSLFIYLRKNNLRMKDKIYELTLNQIDALENIKLRTLKMVNLSFFWNRYFMGQNF